MSNIDESVKSMLKNIQKVNKVSPSVLAGFGWATIVSASPISIKVETGQILTSEFIELSPFCREWKTKRLEHNHKYNVAHTHNVVTSEGEYTTTEEMSEDRETEKEIAEFTYWRGLRVGDKVSYLRVNDSQKYVLLWRDNQFSLDV